jgi:hypothetical protein
MRGDRDHFGALFCCPEGCGRFAHVRRFDAQGD